MAGKLRAFISRIGYTTASFVLAISTLTAAVPFIVAQSVGAATAVVYVDTLQDLKDALEDDTIKEIIMDGRIETTETIVIDRPVLLNGHDEALVFVGDTNGWQGNYVVQVYNVSGLVRFNSLHLEGGDAGVYVNGSSVSMTGNMRFVGHEFGNIELAKGSGVTSAPKLSIPYANSVAANYNESKTKPFVWVDTDSIGDAVISSPYLYKGINRTTNSKNYEQHWYYADQQNTGLPVLDVIAPTCAAPYNQVKFTMESSTRIVMTDPFVPSPADPANPLAIQAGAVNNQGYINLEDFATTYGIDSLASLYGTKTNAVERYIGGYGHVEFGTVTATFVDPATLDCRPVVSIDSPTASLSNTSVEVRGTVTDDDLRRYWVYVTRNGVEVRNSVVLSSGIDNELLYTAVDDGDYVVTLAARDIVGNRSDDVVRSFTVDKTAPAKPTLVSPSDGASANGGPTQRWTHENMADVAYFLYESYSDAGLTSRVYPSSASSPVNLAKATQRTIGGSQNITIWWRIGAVDAAGNVSWSDARQLIVDNSAPTVNVTTTPLVGGPTGKAAINATFDADVVSYAIYIDGDTTPIVAETGVPFTEYLWDTSALASGTYVVRVVVTDAAGNTGENTATVEVDNDGPAALITTTGTQNTATPTISGTVDADATELEFYIDGVLQTAGLTWVPGDTTWLFTGYTFTDGDYDVQIVARDIYSNEGGQIATIEVVVPTIEDDPETEDVDESAPVTTVTPGEVLGEQDTNPDLTPEQEADSDAAELGDSTEKVAQAADTNNDSKIFGLDWYWWVVIVAAAGAAGWWIAAAVRRRNGEE